MSTPSVQPSMTIVYPAPQGQPALTSEASSAPGSAFASPVVTRRAANSLDSVRLPTDSSDAPSWAVERLPVKRQRTSDDDAGIAALIALGGAGTAAAVVFALLKSQPPHVARRVRPSPARPAPSAGHAPPLASPSAPRIAPSSVPVPNDSVHSDHGFYHGRQTGEDNCGLHASNAALRGRGIDGDQQTRFRAFAGTRGSSSSSIEPVDLMEWHNAAVTEIRNNAAGAADGDPHAVHEVMAVTVAVETFIDANGHISVRVPDGSRLTLRDHIASVMQHDMPPPERFDHVIVPTMLMHSDKLHNLPSTHWVTLAWTDRDGGGWHEIDSLKHGSEPRRLGPGAAATVHDAATVVAGHIERHLHVGGASTGHVPGRYLLNVLHPIIGPVR